MNALRPSRLVLLAVLHLGLLAPTHASAKGPTAELRIAPQPSPEIDAALVEALAKLPEELRATFPAVVDGVKSRLRAGMNAAADGSAPTIGAEEAVRAALLAVDFGGVSKRKRTLDAMVRLTVLQLSVDLHASLRAEVGRQLAVRAVIRCKGSSKCLDKIAPSATMPAQQVMTVRAQFGNDVTALAAAELASAAELETLGVMYSGISYLQAVIAQGTVDSAVKDAK